MGAAAGAPIQQAINILNCSGLKCRWVTLENLHLTLKFLGSCPESAVTVIESAMESAANRVGPLATRTETFGAFPHTRSARVLWLGLKESSQLNALYTAVHHKLRESGFEREDRQFRAHITFGRLKRPAPVDLSGLEVVRLGAGLIFDKITLFESHLTPSGPKYEELHHVVLGRKDP